MECDCQKKKKLRMFMRTRDFKEDEIVRLLQAAFQSFVVADMAEIELRKGVVDALYGKTYYEFVIDNARVRVYFATQKIDAVVDVIEKGVKKTDLLPTRYLRDSVIKCLAQIFYKQNQSPSRDDFVEILHKILDTKISKYTVYGQLFGVKITKRKKIGAFEFLPDKTFSAILKSGSLPENVIDLLTNACKGCVCTQVSAGDFDAARALAQEDFKWLENAVRLFATGNGSFFSIGRGVWDYKLPPVVVDCGGKVCGIGGIDGTNPFGDENLIFKNKDLKRVIERLGKSEGLTKMQGALRHGVYLGGMSMQETNRTLAFFLAVSAMESFIVYDDDKYVNAGIAQQIVENYCYLFSDRKERRQVFDSMKQFYRYRSAFAHGGDDDVPEMELARVRDYLKKEIVGFLTSSKLRKISDKNCLGELVRDIKFGEKEIAK